MASDRPYLAEPRLTVQPKPISILGARQFRLLFVPLSVLALIGVVVLVVSGNIALPVTSTTLLDGYAGSKKGFFDDPEVRRILMTHHMQVHVTEVGSREIASQDLKNLDFAFPSGRPAALLITDKLHPAPKTYSPFVSHLVLATYREYAQTLQDAGVAHPQSGQAPSTPYYYDLNLHNFLDLVVVKKSWNSLGIEQHGISNGTNVLARTSDICKSNSAATYLSLVAFSQSPGKDHIPTSDAEADLLSDKIRPLLVGQGFPGQEVDKTYLTPEGEGIAPVAVMYEHQYLAHQIQYQAQTGRLDSQRVLLYPDVAFQTQPEFIALNSRGEQLGELFGSDPALSRRATELGFRISTNDYTDKGPLSEFLNSRGIPVPANHFAGASLPAPNLLERMIQEVGRCQS